MNTPGWILAAGLLLWGAVALVAAAQDRLPEGEGKIQVETSCASRCHPATTVMRAKRTPTGWEMVIDLMIERGAEVTDSEYEVILEYLSQHLLATVNVNTEATGRIAEVLEISDKEAAAIVELRTAQGPFQRWEDVAKVPGLDGKVIEERKARLVFK
jgi:competence ComEA-like helix-hairpin-helix protein